MATDREIKPGRRIEKNDSKDWRKRKGREDRKKGFSRRVCVEVQRGKRRSDTWSASGGQIRFHMGGEENPHHVTYGRGQCRMGQRGYRCRIGGEQGHRCIGW